MSPPSSKNPSPSTSVGKTSIKSVTSVKDSENGGDPRNEEIYGCYVDPEESVRPDFIYGGPFIKQFKPEPLIDTSTPINILLSAAFKKSFAYYSLKERMPIILTRVIDDLSKKGGGEATTLIQHIAKLKNDLMTNKRYTHLKSTTPEAQRWNDWIDAADNQYYFSNSWVFTECYIYRRLWEGCELSTTMQDYDYFAAQKQKSFSDLVDVMCLAADKVNSMLQGGDKKEDFCTLLKLCLWANKCDLSLSAGAPVGLKAPTNQSSPPSPPASPPGSPTSNQSKGTVVIPPSPSAFSIVDPIQMVIDNKDKLLVDDTAKAFDALTTRAGNLAKAIEGAATLDPAKTKCSCDRLAIAAGVPVVKKAPQAPPAPKPSSPGEEGSAEGEAEAPQEAPVPCPAKMTVPRCLYFDIVCDNSGYEVFMDLVLGHFLLHHKIVDKVRYHVKRIPWFVSDVTPNDFKYVIDACAGANVSKTLPPPPPAEDGTEEAGRPISSDSLKSLGKAFQEHLEDEEFVVMCDDYWTSPHVYKDMKKYDPNLYRKLQFAVGILFKGDLNYRKLLGEKNWPSTTGFEPALQGFIPAPIISARTVKAELICGLPKGKQDALNKLDPKWMETGDYGVIHFCGKAEPLKVSDRPCADYGKECKGIVCPADAV